MSSRKTTGRSPEKSPSAPTRDDGRSTEGRKLGRLSERVRAHVFEQIISGALPPGSVIQIGSIAAELGVSRTPVREALLALQQANLVSVIPNQGFLVCTMTLADVKDIYVMRSLLEGATAQRAAARLGTKALEHLTAVHEKACARAENGKYDLEFDSFCHEFHQLIALEADSPRLLAAVEGVFNDYMRLQVVGVNPPDPLLIVEEHGAILSALADSDPVAARLEMQRHVETMRKVAVDTLAG